MSFTVYTTPVVSGMACSTLNGPSITTIGQFLQPSQVPNPAGLQISCTMTGGDPYPQSFTYQVNSNTPVVVTPTGSASNDFATTLNRTGFDRDSNFPSAIQTR